MLFFLHSHADSNNLQKRLFYSEVLTVFVTPKVGACYDLDKAYCVYDYEMLGKPVSTNYLIFHLISFQVWTRVFCVAALQHCYHREEDLLYYHSWQVYESQWFIWRRKWIKSEDVPYPLTYIHSTYTISPHKYVHYL